MFITGDYLQNFSYSHVTMIITGFKLWDCSSCNNYVTMIIYYINYGILVTGLGNDIF